LVLWGNKEGSDVGSSGDNGGETRSSGNGGQSRRPATSNDPPDDDIPF
jgi:hypothetical protein